MYKNNSRLIAKTKEGNNKKGLCLTEKLVLENPRGFSEVSENKQLLIAIVANCFYTSFVIDINKI